MHRLNMDPAGSIFKDGSLKTQDDRRDEKEGGELCNAAFEVHRYM